MRDAWFSPNCAKVLLGIPKCMSPTADEDFEELVMALSELSIDVDDAKERAKSFCK